MISLGHLQRCGAFYGPDPERPLTHFLLSLRRGGPILAEVLLNDSNLLPINFLDLHAASAAATRLSLPTLPPKPAAFLASYNAEQLRRAEAAEDLHVARHHPSDSSLCADLSHGKIPWSHLTSHDVIVNRRLRGPCPHCAAGKLTAPAAPTSVSAPATAPGSVLSFDIHHLPDVAPGGINHEIFVVDESSGRLHIVGTTSKAVPHIFRAVHSVIADYNSFGHRVDIMHGDAERINAALKLPLGLVGTHLQLSLPGEHARRVERYTRTIYEHSSATLSSLPYVLPPKYSHFLHRSVGAELNKSINSRSAPRTPDEVVQGIKQSTASYPFGRSAMVTMHDDKRAAIASIVHHSSLSCPKTVGRRRRRHEEPHSPAALSNTSEP